MAVGLQRLFSDPHHDFSADRARRQDRKASVREADAEHPLLNGLLVKGYSSS
ncbi:hypothetical protein CK203_001292 [Vitis vinifera]|uniref:Uncharacterized protein n=1 Tax=Vitis vinifera TaxID=29760 RepID=A0A438KLR6_VITVI|nr:hypothetical protein CK203_001292 [Vitis vinifera]